MSSPPTILHLGIGAFVRAHAAWYLHRLRETTGSPWELAVASIRPEMAPLLDALAERNGAYTLETVTPRGERAYERIESIGRVLRWAADGANAIATGADAQTRIISFTVTESGYYLTDRDELDVAHPDIAADLGGARTTIYGALSAIMRARIAAGGAPVTLLSCDNLRSNGARFRRGFLAFLERSGARDVIDFVQASTTAPSSMVDRITPRPTPEVRARVHAATGVDDPSAVLAESFVQWVVEDAFIAGRPAWESVGVTFAPSVHPYEEAKIRILNASHSCIAWAGTLAGYTYIHEGVHDPEIRAFAESYVTNDVIPCLEPSPIDLGAYRDVVLDRFSNAHIADTNARVAADGYAKIAGFIVPTLAQRIERGVRPDATAMLPALFFCFIERWNAGMVPFTYHDGVIDRVYVRGLFTQPDPLAEFLGDERLWGALTGNGVLRDVVINAAHRVRAWQTRRSP